jgi:small-conductance mechanosensitive channel
MSFSLNVQLARFEDQYVVQSDLRKRIVKKFQQEGIEIPFPTRTLVIDQPGKDLLNGSRER